MPSSTFQAELLRRQHALHQQEEQRLHWEVQQLQEQSQWLEQELSQRQGHGQQHQQYMRQAEALPSERAAALVGSTSADRGTPSHLQQQGQVAPREMAQLGSRQERMTRVYASGQQQQQATVTANGGGSGGGSGRARDGQAVGRPPLPLPPPLDPSRSSSGDGCSGSGDGPSANTYALVAAAAYYPDVPTTDSDGDVGSHFGPWLIRGSALPEVVPSVGDSLLDDDAAPMLGDVGEAGSYEGEEEEEEGGEGAAAEGGWGGRAYVRLTGADPDLGGIGPQHGMAGPGGAGGSSAGLEDEFSFGDYGGAVAIGSPKPFLRGSRGSLGRLQEGEEGDGLHLVDNDDGADEEGREEEEEDISADALRRVPSDVVRRAEHYAGEHAALPFVLCPG